MTKELKRLLRKSRRFVYTYNVKLSSTPHISSIRRKRLAKKKFLLKKVLQKRRKTNKPIKKQ